VFVAIVVLVIGAISLLSSDNKSDTSANTYKSQSYSEYSFSSEQALQDHFNKHGSEFGYSTKEEYLQGAINVIENPASLKEIEKEDGDIVYYLQSTNEIVFVSPSGTIRTYFRPDDGIDYFNRQQVTIFRLIA
jgi:pyocin large subunit-like protein